MIRLPIKFLNKHATLPTYGSDTAAGMDLCANFGDEPGSAYNLEPGARKLFKTGIAAAIPEGYYGRIAPRSGLAYKHGIDVLAGVIDNDYRGDIGIILINFGNADFVVKHGDRIAQMIITPCEMASPMTIVQDELPEAGRGDGGFGSTGR
jgi:dUTP pyrophosphatase